MEDDLGWKKTFDERRPSVEDDLQWVLTEEDKLEIIGTVLQIAITALFENHYYSFGGKMFRQRGEGPIGLRGGYPWAKI